MNNNSNKRKNTETDVMNSEAKENLNSSTSQPDKGITDDNQLGTSEENSSRKFSAESEESSKSDLFQTSGLNSQLEELRSQGLLDDDNSEEQVILESTASAEQENLEEPSENKEALEDTENTAVDNKPVVEAVELKDFFIDESDKEDSQKTPEEKEENPKAKSKLKEYAFVRKNSDKNEDIFGPEFEAIKEKRKKRTIASVLGVFALLVLVYAGGVFYFRDRFLPNTYVNGESISGKTLSEADEAVSSLSSNRTVKLLGSDGLESEIKASDVGFNLTETPDLEKALSEQNAYSWPLHLFPNNSTKIDNASTINEEVLTNTIANLEMVSGPQVVKTENAKAVFNEEDGQFVAGKEVYGTEVDVPKLINRVRESLVDGNPVINLEEEDDYVRPVTHEDSEKLAQSVDKLNSIKETVITYDFKNAQEKLDKNTFLSWLTTTETGEPMVNQEMAAQYVAGLAQKYDTLDRPVNFTTSSGAPIQVHDWVMGWQINQPQEVTELTQAILDGNSVTREPVYSSTGRDRMSNNSIINTYLEISISDQHMWFYKNGQLVVDTPIVTGDPSHGNGTPEGLFNLQDKEMYVTLTGADYASPVTYWLPFDGGVGVHDASWRSSYGGSIYYGNGSHGCVNTPYSAVRSIYENIDVETPVVVY